MDKNGLDLCLDVLQEKTSQNYTLQSENYEKLYNVLNDIIGTCFSDLNNGELCAFPFGDFLTNTYYDNSIVDFYVIYSTNRDNIDFTVTEQRVTKKGKTKVSLYQSIIGAPINKGVLQAEDVAQRLHYKLNGQFKSIFSYCKRNQIMIRISDKISARINVCYDFAEENGDLTIRKINIWSNINPVKYLDNFDKKDAETNGNFHTLVRLFKALEIELIINEESELLIGKNYFVENLLYNVPSKLFIGENFETIITKVLDYLKFKDYDEFKLIDETGFMHNIDFYSKNYAKQFINKINYTLENLQDFI